MAARSSDRGFVLLFSAALLAFVSGPLAGQAASRLVYAFVGVKAPDDMKTESREVEMKLVSELVRLGVSENFSVVTPKNRDFLLENLPVGASAASRRASLPPSDGLPSARGMIIGDLARAGGGLRLRIDMLRTETLQTQNSAEAAARDVDVLQREITRVLHVLFDLPEPQALPQPVPPDIAALPEPPAPDALRPLPGAPSLADLSGTWKRENEAESVRIRADGSAVADLGGWNTMRLSVSIEDGKVVVRQDEPNSPKLYLGRFPYSTAVRVAEVARPLRWIMVLSRDKKMLSGIRESTFFVIDGGEIVSVDNSFVQEEVWLKVP
jgi:hypothetical protein